MIPSQIPIKYSPTATIPGSKPIVIIGPNGSGKTRYSRQLAQWNRVEVIPALRNVGLTDMLRMSSPSMAEAAFRGSKAAIMDSPWQPSHEIDDMFAKIIADDAESARRFRDAHIKDSATRSERTTLMVLCEVWASLFPGRELIFDDYRPRVTSELSTGDRTYPAQQMSDGERVALYLAARVLAATEPVIVIDEPEVHFHSRLAARFWDELQALKPETRFVYVTHDLSFALSRRTEHFIIVRAGSDQSPISLSDNIPSDVARSLLAAASFSIFAKRIVFCEGTESSHDEKIYSAWFNDRETAVVPVGSCRDVIRCAETFASESLISGVEAIGLIDSDYWPDCFLSAVPPNVRVLSVHEVESLFCLRGVFIAVASHLCHQGDLLNLFERGITEARGKFVGGLLTKQISERFRCRCEHEFRQVINSLGSGDTIEAAKEAHLETLSPSNWPLSPERVFEEEATVIQGAVNGDEDDFLKYLPGKTIFHILAAKLGVKPEAYVRIVVEGLRAGNSSNLGSELERALSSKLPDRRL